MYKQFLKCHNPGSTEACVIRRTFNHMSCSLFSYFHTLIPKKALQDNASCLLNRE